MYTNTYSEPQTLRARITLVKVLTGIVTILAVVVIPIQGIEYLENRSAEESTQVLGESTSVFEVSSATTSVGNKNEKLTLIIGSVMIAAGFVVLMYFLWDYRRNKS